MKIFFILFVVLVMVAPVQAKNNKHKGGKKSEPITRTTEKKTTGILPPPPPPLPGMSRDRQQDVIDRYFRSTEPERYEHRYDDGGSSRKKAKKKKNLPRGLQKKVARGKALPPGWQKKVARGEVLGHDLRGHCQELPRELYVELPRPPKGTKFLRLEDKIIRVVESTFEIVDVFTMGR